jgi:hypothetical protein
MLSQTLMLSDDSQTYELNETASYLEFNALLVRWMRKLALPQQLRAPRPIFRHVFESCLGFNNLNNLINFTRLMDRLQHFLQSELVCLGLDWRRWSHV